MKILVTGGTGMLGSAIIRLYHQEHELHFIGRNAAIVQQLSAKYPVTGHVADLCDLDAISKIFADIEQDKSNDEQIDAIIHCAALSSPWGAYQAFEQGNVQATRNLLAVAEQYNIQTFVHVSTTSVYFDFTDRWNITEQDPVASPFCNDYAETKYLAEQAVLASSNHSVILRPRGIFGPNDQAIVPRLLAAIKGRYLLLPSAKNPVLDLTYVDNVATAALLACAKGPSLPKGEIFNITNGEPMPINSVLVALLAALGYNARLVTLPYALIAPIIALNEFIRRRLAHRPEPKITVYGAGLLHFHQTLNIEKANQLLGYQASVSITEGIRRYVDWTKNKTV
ncbi:NAD(P)-dependent oxidoreductase [Motilimonas sp. E26]|uniref:NAD-dependent epimerase/dehydratase family protein n=1 Tax=Motilimonas sp. E26 TaxID=2865674 RepID=UPI001E388ABB|nr:NAD(P)-dependent oxidoreductase [Motilimonas sp. E26]MCE0556098.1 NAD(P)-dependent oxidoreductase [Motilimonas sp. E26]